MKLRHEWGTRHPRRSSPAQADTLQHRCKIGTLKTQTQRIHTVQTEGLFDPTATLADGQFLQSHIAGSELVTLPTAHISSAQAPQEFTSLLHEFFAKN